MTPKKKAAKKVLKRKNPKPAKSAPKRAREGYEAVKGLSPSEAKKIMDHLFSHVVIADYDPEEYKNVTTEELFPE